MKTRRNYKIDYFLIVVSVLLIMIGILVLSSVSAVFSQQKFGKTTYYLLHQIMIGIIPGILLGFIAFKISLDTFKRWAFPLILANLVLMVLVFIPGIGVVVGGASRWINLRFISFQPSEVLKLASILYLAVWLSGRIEKKHLHIKKRDWKNTLFPFLVVIAVVALLLTCQSDLSTLGVIIAVAGLMYFSSDTPIWHTILVAGTGLIILFFLIKFVPYRMERFLVFLNPQSDPMGAGYQIKQALITIGSGGIFGLGLGMSSQKFGFLPQTMSDSIFAIFAEEAGFFGGLILIVLFLLFLWRAFKISKNSKDRFSQLFALGFGSWICLQAFINIGSMIGILPLTGIPLPFISYGGSHIVAELIGLGILLNISKTG